MGDDVKRGNTGPDSRVCFFFHSKQNRESLNSLSRRIMWSALHFKRPLGYYVKNRLQRDRVEGERKIGVYTVNKVKSDGGFYLMVQMDAGFILKIGLVGFPDRFDVGCNRKYGVEDDSNTFDLSNWENLPFAIQTDCELSR